MSPPRTTTPNQPGCWQGLAGLLLLVALVLLSIQFYSYLRTHPGVSASVVAATGGLIATGISVQRARQRDREEARRPQKAEIYGRFVDVALEAVRKLDQAGPAHVRSICSQLPEFARDFVVWSPPYLVKEFGKFWLLAAHSNSEGEILTSIENMLRAIRKDLGNDNDGLDPGDLVFLAKPVTDSQSKKS